MLVTLDFQANRRHVGRLVGRDFVSDGVFELRTPQVVAATNSDDDFVNVAGLACDEAGRRLVELGRELGALFRVLQEQLRAHDESNDVLFEVDYWRCDCSRHASSSVLFAICKQHVRNSKTL